MICSMPADTDRFELMASTRATRSWGMITGATRPWDADRFELQVGNQGNHRIKQMEKIK